MTEEEWLTCDDPEPIMAFLRGKATDRKLRLLNVAACRAIWRWLPERCRNVTAVLELYADDLVGTVEYQEAWGQADIECRMCAQDPPDALMYAAESVMISSPPTTASVGSTLSTATLAIGCDAAANVQARDYDATFESARLRAAGEQAQLLREIFGNPFHPVAFDAAWRTSDVMLLAQGIYDEKAFDRMPILADALEEAGCDNADILNHLRDPHATHVRGCWALDLVLGKS